MTDGYGYVKAAFTTDEASWKGWGGELQAIADGVSPMPPLPDTFTTLPFAEGFRQQFAQSRQLLLDYITAGADDYAAIGERLGWVVERYDEAEDAALALIAPLTAELGG